MSQERYPIRKIAVLGAGVMGSTLAAHFANAGIPSVLLDIVPPTFTEEDERKGLSKTSREFRNRFAINGIEHAKKMKPAALYDVGDAALITPGNFEDDLDLIADVDWIIEVVKEDLDIKRKLLGNVAKHWREGTIVTTNTSGLPIAQIVATLPEDLQKHFLGTHFFNPPRYMRLLELIPGPKTLPEIVSAMREFCDRVLGKGVVLCKDTPNFVANRIGVFGMLHLMHTMLAEGLGIEEADQVAGPPMGRPRSAAFRTADIVGLDTLVHVADNLYQNVPEDECRETFKVPQFVRKMVEKGWLGDKSGQGFYKKESGEGGKKDILVLEPSTMEYRAQRKLAADSLAAAKNEDDVGRRVKNLVEANDTAASFAWKVLSDTLIYSANRVGEIADDIASIDDAMRWGFGWDLGPFETWDAIGLEDSVERMKREGKKIPRWIDEMIARGNGSFYRRESGVVSVYDPRRAEYAVRDPGPGVIVLASLAERKKTIKANAGASLIDIGDGVACLEFHTKMNSIDADIISMIDEALAEVEKNFVGLVIGNDATNFSVGANIMLIFMEAQAGNFDRIAEIVNRFQQACVRLRHSPKPVVAAPAGMALGGGAEIAMGADRIRAHAELYMGLVEVGVGLIPGGGGTVMVLARHMEGIPEDIPVDPFPFTRRAFETIAMAKVSTSAEDARRLRLLRAHDSVTMNRARLIGDAKKVVLHMAAEDYRPPRRRDIPVAGESGRAALMLGLEGLRQGGYATEYDCQIGRKLAFVMTGGRVPSGTRVSEQYLLDLEREAFVSLCGEEKTKERIQHMLMKGKPLRN